MEIGNIAKKESRVMTIKMIQDLRKRMEEQIEKIQEMVNEEQGFPVGSVVKNLPAMQEIWVQFLGHEDPLEKGMATYSSILAQEIPWTEEPGGLQSVGSKRVGHD